MGETTIEWTGTPLPDGTMASGYTFNPWWGCTKVSAGCTNCYADTLATRYGHKVWGPKAPRRFFGDKHWLEPLKWDRQAAKDGVRRKVFCASMADVFEEHMLPLYQAEMDLARERLWDLIERTWNLDWLVLTKRPENVLSMVDVDWKYDHVGFPPNFWIGTSTENQEQADKRIPELLKIPACVRFLSAEPLLGSIDLDEWLLYERRLVGEAHFHEEVPIHWVITGGESGAGARPCNPDWVRDLRDQCVEAGVAFFHKQWGEWRPRLLADYEDESISPKQLQNWTFDGERVLITKVGKRAAGRLLDGREWSEFPVAR